MRVEFFRDGNQDCPAIIFYGCPSAGAETLIAAFRSLSEGRQVEVALHRLPDIRPVGAIEVFASIHDGASQVEQASDPVFRWRNDSEGWLEVAELAEPVAHSDPGEGPSFQYLERHGKVNVILFTPRAW